MKGQRFVCLDGGRIVFESEHKAAVKAYRRGRRDVSIEVAKLVPLKKRKVTRSVT